LAAAIREGGDEAIEKAGLLLEELEPTFYIRSHEESFRPADYGVLADKEGESGEGTAVQRLQAAYERAVIEFLEAAGAGSEQTKIDRHPRSGGVRHGVETHVRRWESLADLAADAGHAAIDAEAAAINREDAEAVAGE